MHTCLRMCERTSNVYALLRTPRGTRKRTDRGHKFVTLHTRARRARRRPRDLCVIWAHPPRRYRRGCIINIEFVNTEMPFDRYFYIYLYIYIYMYVYCVCTAECIRPPQTVHNSIVYTLCDFVRTAKNLLANGICGKTITFVIFERAIIWLAPGTR